jgi:hypothetical protein
MHSYSLVPRSMHCAFASQSFSPGVVHRLLTVIVRINGATVLYLRTLFAFAPWVAQFVVINESLLALTFVGFARVDAQGVLVTSV